MSYGPKQTDNLGDHAEKPHRRRHIRILGRHIPVPQSVAMRRTLGGGLVAGGILGFLPVLGFWMVPLGLVVLSQDSAIVRRKRRQLEVKILRRWKASRFGTDKDKN
ncbi:MULTISPECIES: hypothetical protein [unclassified Phyllobacterium]|uniref:hypothetical protein n=1 Tax=unclassified Phyllobacterium TaxID=2638441 RepID=UPI003012F89E